MNPLKLLLVLCITMLASIAGAAAPAVSADGAWTNLDLAAMSARSTPAARKWINPEKFAAYSMNAPAVRTPAFAAPSDTITNIRSSAVILTVPRPDGTFERFQIVDVQTMEPALAAKYPDIRTFSGAGVDDPSATIRGDIGPQGFRASVRNDSGWYYVDPLYHGNTDLHVSYLLKDSGPESPLRCDVTETASAPVSEAAAKEARDAFGTDFRTVRVAMAATGEYSATVDGTVAGTQAAIVSLINRVNQIFEADVAVRMILVGDNDDLIYLDGTTDPYTDGDTGDLLDENQPNVDLIIGSANYDIAQVLNSTGSGLASLNSVCDNSKKARGTSSIRGGSPLDNQSVYHTAHEMGHQYGAGHSWSGTGTNCSAANFSAPDGYEPGSGSTLMGYPGTCSPDNVRTGKEAYFHRRSLDTMISYISGSLGCSTLAVSGNNPPTVNAGTDIYVPVNTPFKLKAAATDANGDTVFYCWEQFDLATDRRPLGSADDGTGPLFRSIFPTSNPARYFPANPAVPTDNEVIPTFAGVNRNFVVTARDFRSGGGGTNDDSLVVSVIDAPSIPLEVTVGNTPGEFWTGSTHLITWNVGETDTLPYNIFNVNIMLSIDGGETYAYMLKENTPNDGDEIVLLPNVNSTTVRIRVEPTGSGVFDISDADIILGGHIDVNPAVADFGVVCAGDVIDRVLTVFNTGSGDLTLTNVSISGPSAFTLVPSNANPEPGLPVIIQPGEHIEYTVNFAAPNIPGPISSTITINSSDPTQPAVDIVATATIGEPDIITTIPNSGSFGDVCLGSIKDMPITVTNGGICDLRITAISSSSPDFVVPNVVTFPLVVQAGTSVEIPIRFQPTSLGAKAGFITIASTDLDQPNVQVNVSGNVPGGKITVAPCPLDFGLVCLEDLEAREKDVTVCNTGKCPLNVSAVTITGMDFQIEGLPALPVSLQSGSCFTFTIKFTPTSIGPKVATYTVVSDDPDNPVVNCQVTGETVANSIGVPSRIPFDPTVISTVSHCVNDQPLVVINNGLCNAQVTTVSISGINADSFTLVGLPTATDALSLAPGEQLGEGNLYIRFCPAAMITERFHQAQANVTFIVDPFTLEEVTKTIPLMGEATQTGFRVLVRAGGVPVSEVLSIKARVKGLGANGKKQKKNLKMKNANLRSVDAPAPFADDLSFQYHGEFGALTNSTQLPTGEVLMKVKFRIGKKKVTRTIRFQNLDTCTFNKDVIADF